MPQNIDWGRVADWAVRLMLAGVIAVGVFLNGIMFCANLYYMDQFSKVIKKFKEVTRTLEQDSKDDVKRRLYDTEGSCMAGPSICRL